jgi:hypothetical protein
MTTDTSAGTSAMSYHDSLMKALDSVINASKQLKMKLQTGHPGKKAELTTRFTILGSIEETVLQQVRETNPTPGGLVKAICLLESYREFTKEKYAYMSNLSPQVAPNEEKQLQDAIEQLSKLIRDVQDFIIGTSQSQIIFQGATSGANGSETNQQLMDDVVNLTKQVEQMQRHFSDFAAQTQTSIQAATDHMQASIQKVVEDAVNQLFKGLNPASGASSATGSISTPPPILGSGPSPLASGGFLSGSTSAPIADEMFWLRGQVKNKEIQLTEKLLQGPLDDPKDQNRLAKLTVDKLISDWEKANNAFVGQTQPILTNGDPQQIALATSALFFVHRQLQTLYNNLNATVIQQQPVTIQI